MGAISTLDRPDIYVLSRILERLWRETGPMLKTRLQVATNVNYDILSKYLAWMFEKGFIVFEQRDGHEMVALTRRGKDAYFRIVQVVNEVLRGG